MKPLMDLAICPGSGVGQLAFGMTRSEVRSLIGAPEREAWDECRGERSVTWYYWSAGLSLHFHGGEGFRLGTIEVDSERTTLDGRQVLGLDEEALEAALPGFHPSEEVAYPDDDTRRIDFDQAGLTFWFERGIARSVQVCVIFDEEDEPCWPKRSPA